MKAELIEFPVSFNVFYGKILDARNREIATIKTVVASDATRLEIGDFVADAMNRQYVSNRRHVNNRAALKE